MHRIFLNKLVYQKILGYQKRLQGLGMASEGIWVTGHISSLLVRWTGGQQRCEEQVNPIY